MIRRRRTIKLANESNFPLLLVGPVHFWTKGCMVVFIFFIQVLIEPFISNQRDPDQTPKNKV